MSYRRFFSTRSVAQVNDVSNAVYAAIREPLSIGQTYEIYGSVIPFESFERHVLRSPERYQLRELIEYCLRYMRRKSVITPLTPDVL